MSRTKGARNKPKPRKNTLVTLKLAKDVDGSAMTPASSFGWVNYGQRNDYPQKLLELYQQSPTHRACVNFGVQSILGNGIDWDAMQLDGSQILPNRRYDWNELIRRISLDYELFGSYAIQVIKNNDNQTYSFYHMPLDKVRWSEYDDDGEVPFYYVSNDWKNVGMYPPVQLEAFDSAKEVKRGKAYLYVYRTYSPTQEYYCSPQYSAAIKAIQAEIEHQNFDLRSAVNSFVPAGALSLNEPETEEEKRDLIDNVTALFSGTENANSILISFRNNVEQLDPSFTPFTTSSENFNLFADANQRTIARILAGHQIPCASLVGLPDIGSTGFSSEADKLQVAYEIYNKLVGNFNRMAVVQTLNTLFAINGVDVELILKPLSFNDFDEDANVEERTTINVDDEDINKQANAEEE